MAKRNDVTVKVDADVIRDAKLVAVYRGVSVAELLSDLLRPLVSKMVDEEQEKAKRAKARKPPADRGQVGSGGRPGRAVELD